MGEAKIDDQRETIQVKSSKECENNSDNKKYKTNEENQEEKLTINKVWPKTKEIIEIVGKITNNIV